MIEESAGGEHVAAHDGLGPLAVAVLECVADLAMMVLTARQGVVGVLVKGPHHQRHVDDGVHHRRQLGTGGQRKQVIMKFAVLSGQGIQVTRPTGLDGLFHRRAQCSQPRDVGGTGACGRTTSPETFQRGPQLKCLTQVLAAPFADPRTTMGQVLDEAFDAQPLQRLTYRGATDAELHCEIILTQPYAW